MIEILPNLPDTVVGVRASGTVTAEDYETVLIPAVDAAVKEHGPVRLLYFMDCSIRDFSLGAMWDDAKLGFQHLQDFERIAIVTDDHLIRGMVGAFHFTMPKYVRLYHSGEQDAAAAWVAE